MSEEGEAKKALSCRTNIYEKRSTFHVFTHISAEDKSSPNTYKLLRHVKSQNRLSLFTVLHNCLQLPAPQLFHV